MSGLGFDFFEDADCGVSCAICGQSHEWVRPGKTQPTCDCDMFCRQHATPVRFEIRGEDHPVNVASRQIGYGMGIGYHCPTCEAETDAEIIQKAASHG